MFITIIRQVKIGSVAQLLKRQGLVRALLQGLLRGGAVVTAGVGIAIAMGPVGWVILIGAGLATGYAAGKVADALGQGFSGLIYDVSTDINWF